MSGIIAAASLEHAAGTSIGGPVWLAGGLAATGSASATTSGKSSLACLAWGWHGWHTGTERGDAEH